MKSFRFNPTLPDRQTRVINPAFRRQIVVHVAMAVATCCTVSITRAADTRIEYNRDVRPILFDNCFSCHGPDSASRQADLRLDKREVAVEKTAIVPGDPDSSEMIRRILSDDPTEQMPPPETKKTLTDAQKQVIVKWIKAGAEYQPHWSLIAPTKPPVPKVTNSAWPRNPIDDFVLAKLESVGLSPAPEADR